MFKKQHLKIIVFCVLTAVVFSCLDPADFSARKGIVSPDGPSGLSSQDAFEPDSTFNLATRLYIDSSAQSHTLNPGTDEDYFSFFVDSTQIVELHVESAGDLKMFVFNSDHSRVIDSDDDGGPGFNPLITFVAPKAGMYFLSVLSFPQTDTIAYTIFIVKAAGNLAPDIYESTRNGQFIPTDNTIQYHTIYPRHDVDQIQFPMHQNFYYQIVMTRTDTLGPIPGFFGADIGVKNFVFSDTILLLIKSIKLGRGAVIVNYSNVINSAIGDSAIGAYSIRVLEKTDIADAYEPDDDSSHASVIQQQNGAMFHTLDSLDTDYVALDINANVADTLFIRNQSFTSLRYNLYTFKGTTIGPSGNISQLNKTDTLIISNYPEARYLCTFQSVYANEVTQYTLTRKKGQ